MVMPGRSQLNGEVEVDETFVGCVKPGVRGRGAAGKTLVLIAAEVRGVAIGRIRLQVIPDASAATLLPAVSSLVEPGSDIVTDGWTAYLGLPKLGFNHTISRATPAMGNNLLPHVHRIASLLKRWLLGTHQGAVSHDLLQYYLDEFVFRFNRRSSGSRGLIFLTLLQQSLNHVPVTKSNMNPTALKSASMGGHASPLPHGLDASQDVLREFARKYIWWLTPDEALEFPMRIVCQTMNIGLFDDVARLTDSVGEEVMRSALRNAEVGQFNPRSWHYWHYRLGIATPGQVPAMPVKSFLT
jgi:transposase-like protein